MLRHLREPFEKLPLSPVCWRSSFRSLSPFWYHYYWAVRPNWRVSSWLASQRKLTNLCYHRENRYSHDRGNPDRSNRRFGNQTPLIESRKCCDQIEHSLYSWIKCIRIQHKYGIVAINGLLQIPECMLYVVIAYTPSFPKPPSSWEPVPPEEQPWPHLLLILKMSKVELSDLGIIFIALFI